MVSDAFNPAARGVWNFWRQESEEGTEIQGASSVYQREGREWINTTFGGLPAPTPTPLFAEERYRLRMQSRGGGGEWLRWITEP